MDVGRRANAFRDRLRELEVLGVESSFRIGLRNHQCADAISVRLDRHRDQAPLRHRLLDLFFFLVPREIDDVVATNVVEEERPANLEHCSGNSFARPVRMRLEILAESLDIRA